MNVSEFDYELPAERIAQRPLEDRDASRMLVMARTTGSLEDRMFRGFEELLRGDELIVVNNVRVLPARLWGRRKGLNAQPIGKNSPVRHENLTSPIEVLLLRAVGADEWDALVRPGRK
ncbi:MAG: S-adenosylmethionine:tRNA ribosyltransferase-isomerase, partial [Candidatus Acidiferrales bacterium]